MSFWSSELFKKKFKTLIKTVPFWSVWDQNGIILALSKTTSFWSQIALNDVVLICIKNKNKKPNPLSAFSTATRNEKMKRKKRKKKKMRETYLLHSIGGLLFSLSSPVFSGFSSARQSGLVCSTSSSPILPQIS